MSLVAGVFLLFFALYALSGPGRIDIIDGEYRFEVAWNLIEIGKPAVRDAHLLARTGVDGVRYSFYGMGASVAALPLVALGYLFGGANGELGRFLFTFTSAAFAAGILALLLATWLRFGIPRRTALAWTAVVGCATLLWPLATSTFDQAQHAFFVLASVCAAQRASESARPRSWALLSGLLAGAIILYQLVFVLIAPWLALALLGNRRPWRLREALRLAVPFAAGLLSCAALACFYNIARWGSPLDIGAIPGHPGLANPLLGVLGLLVSPGKGVLWYSPVVVLQLLSLRALWRQRPGLALAVVVLSIVHLLFMASLSFYGGDWCWGPRYLVVTLPLLSLGLPLLARPTRARRWLVRSVVTLGVLVQLAGLSLDQHGFFFARALRPHFWTDQSYYFRHSQLVSRVHELKTAIEGKPMSALPFAPGPYPTLPAYCIFGATPSLMPELMKWYPVFYLPRPWPFWIPTLPRELQPAPPLQTTAVFLALCALGALFLRRGLREPPEAATKDAIKDATLLAAARVPVDADPVQ